jgi:hypothetical protein
MENNLQPFISEVFNHCFAMPNCSRCTHFEVVTVYEYCNLHDKITEGKICNGFRLKDANA